MTKQLIIAMLIEALMIGFTLLMLLQPKFLFKPTSARARGLATYSGLVLLCLTFCWSVIFGCVLAINQMTFKF